MQDYFEYSLKEDEEEIDNPLRKIYTTKIENRITFKIKAGYYIKLLSPESIKLFGSTKIKITKDENSKNMPELEINEVALGHCNMLNNGYEQDSRVLYRYIPNKSFANY